MKLHETHPGTRSIKFFPFCRASREPRLWRLWRTWTQRNQVFEWTVGPKKQPDLARALAAFCAAMASLRRPSTEASGIPVACQKPERTLGFKFSLGPFAPNAPRAAPRGRLGAWGWRRAHHASTRNPRRRGGPRHGPDAAPSARRVPGLSCSTPDSEEPVRGPLAWPPGPLGTGRPRPAQRRCLPAGVLSGLGRAFRVRVGGH